jgi:hypothetical protein
VCEPFFTPRLRFNSYEEPNGWLLDQCIAYAKAHRHPERDETIWSAFQAEWPSLVSYAGRFDGFHAVPASVSKTCLVRFDNNKYSVMAKALGRPVEVHAYADRIVIRQDGAIFAEHARCFGRGETDENIEEYFRSGRTPKRRVRPRRQRPGPLYRTQGTPVARLNRLDRSPCLGQCEPRRVGFRWEVGARPIHRSR